MHGKNPTYRWCELIVDLSGVETHEHLAEALAKSLGVNESETGYDPDLNLGEMLYEFATHQDRPYDGNRIIFIGWDEFEKIMPKRSKQFIRAFKNYARWHPHALELEYR